MSTNPWITWIDRRISYVDRSQKTHPKKLSTDMGFNQIKTIETKHYNTHTQGGLPRSTSQFCPHFFLGAKSYLKKRCWDCWGKHSKWSIPSFIKFSFVQNFKRRTITVHGPKMSQASWSPKETPSFSSGYPWSLQIFAGWIQVPRVAEHKYTKWGV